MRIRYSKKAENYLQQLVQILYAEEYFGFKDSAYQYVTDLMLAIETAIHVQHHKPAPVYFSKYGKSLFYISYPKNKNTTWYIFFRIYANGTCFIKYITNNHTEGQYL